MSESQATFHIGDIRAPGRMGVLSPGELAVHFGHRVPWRLRLSSKPAKALIGCLVHPRSIPGAPV